MKESWNPEAIRYSRILHTRRIVPIAASISIGLSIYTLLGHYLELTRWGTLVPAFLLTALLSLVLILTYSERIGVLPGRGGPYNIAQTSQILWVGFGTGWILLAGYGALFTVLAYGAGLNLDLLIQVLFNQAIDPRWLSLAVIGVVGLTHMVGRTLRWRFRIALIVAGILVVVFISIRGLIIPEGIVGSSYSTASSTSTTTLAALMMSFMWALVIIMNLRDFIHRPTRTIPIALVATMTLTILLGILASFVLTRYPVTLTESTTPLVDIQAGLGLIPEALLRAIYAFFGLATILIALNLTLDHGLRLMDELVHDGFLPQRLVAPTVTKFSPRLGIVMLLIASLLLIFIRRPMIIVGLTSLTFLWSTALVHLPDVLRSGPELPENRRPKLPFHPLFPGLSLAIGALLPFTLPVEVWLIGGAWVIAGALVYLTYARQHGIEVRRHLIVIDEERAAAEEDFRVMVALRQSDDPENLIRAGAAMAESCGGDLVVLQTIVRRGRVSDYHRLKSAQEAWEELDDFVDGLGITSVEVTSVVRLAPSEEDGIMEAVQEESTNLLLLGWNGDLAPERMSPDDLLNEIFRKAACDVAVLRGGYPARVCSISVPAAGGPHAPQAFALGQKLVDPEGEIQLFLVVTDDLTPESEAAAMQILRETAEKVDGNARVVPHVVHAHDPVTGIISQAAETDLLLIGASREGLFERPLFGGVPVNIAHASKTPTMITRGMERQRFRILHLIWGFLTDFLPEISRYRKAEVVRYMQDAAVPTVDFFILIVLSAAIASLGLMQNSAAVIIGAMLVAPLMSPILAMGMSLVQGDLHTLGTAAEATVKGVTLAIVMGIVMVIISPIDSPTAEILARTKPNILDLLIALFSGLAAGYAISRNEVAAAMPGVAISAALVPPLCVVGYGIGTANFSIAIGSSLLFITNLVVITFAAAVVFLALGFYPERGDRSDLARNLRTSFISLGVIFIILSLLTYSTVVQANRESMVKKIFNDEIVSQAALVETLDIRVVEGVYIIDAVVLNYAESNLTPEEFDKIDQMLQEAVGGEVQINATLVEAERSTIDFEHAAQSQKLQDLFTAAMDTQGVLLIEMDVTPGPEEYLLEAAIIDIEGVATPDYLATLADELGTEIGIKVVLDVVTIEGVREQTR